MRQRLILLAALLVVGMATPAQAPGPAPLAPACYPIYRDLGQGVLIVLCLPEPPKQNPKRIL